MALLRLTDILHALVPSGFSALVDVSKEFYHFPTKSEDQPYLQVIHPKDGHYLAYAGFLMGSASSLGVAGQGVAALM